MRRCPLCVLEVPEEEHTPERWAAITRKERQFVSAWWRRQEEDQGRLA